MAETLVLVNSEPVTDETPNGEATPQPSVNLMTPTPDEPETSPDLQRIFDLEDEVSRCEADYLAKAESAKNAKKCLEAAQDSLNRFIRRLKEKLPLFDRPSTDGMSEPPAAEPWREDSVRKLEGLSESVYEAMEEAGLFTIGQLCDWREGHDLIELPGIGAAKVTKIEDALELFWAQEVSR